MVPMHIQDWLPFLIPAGIGVILFGMYLWLRTPPEDDG